MTAADGALAGSALSTRQNAVAAQYGAAAPTGQVLGIQTEGGGAPGSSTPASGVAGETTSGSNPSGTTADTQPARQVSAATASGLPFTGFAAIPLMLLGLLTLAGGVLIRRGTKRSADSS